MIQTDKKKLKRSAMLCCMMLLGLVAWQPLQAQGLWTEVVTSQPAGFQNTSVDTPEELAWVISLVNGRSDLSPAITANPNLEVIITGDIDMSGHDWVPIGTVTSPYTGHFDGGGHLISGMNFIRNDDAPAGMFGTVAGSAIIEKVFVNNAGQGSDIGGWYLPSAGQWRKLESALPFLNTAAASAAGYREPTAARQYWTSSLAVAGEKAVRMNAFRGVYDLETASNTSYNSTYVRGIRDYIGTGKHLGDVVEFTDGSSGVVFHVNRDDTGGWTVALTDASPSQCNWLKTSTNFNVNGLSALYADASSYYTFYLAEQDGFSNTLLMRQQEGKGSYSAGLLGSKNPEVSFTAANANYLGGLVGELKGNATLRYSEAATKVNSAKESSCIGGLAGHVADNAQIHSCMAFTKMNGHSIGGLAGKVEGTASVINSFSKGYYEFLSSGTSNHVDGFVADNAGTVSNCYTLMQNEGVVSTTGWHLPSAGELRTFWAAYSVIPATAFTANGGTDPSPNNEYWSSTVYSSGTVATVLCSAFYAKEPSSITARVRGVRSYSSTTRQNIGDVLSFTDIVDGQERTTKGIVFWINPDDDGLTGWAVNVKDANNGTAVNWGDDASGADPINPGYWWALLYDTDGNANMDAMIAAQGSHAYAAMPLAQYTELQFSPTSSANYFACYSPEGYGYAENANTGEFTKTETPYLYNHKDNRVTMQGASEESGSLLSKLNSWVDAHENSSEGSKHAHWLRTGGSTINGDYPVLRLDGNVNGSLTDFTAITMRNELELQYGNLKGLLPTVTESDIFFYGKEDVKYADKYKGVKLYIDGEASLTGNAAYDNVYAGITFPSDYKWHTFSTPLAEAPLGIDYTAGSSTIGQWVTPYRYPFYTESTEDGYFPSHRYGTTYGTEAADYYDNWDYYCFYEPEYHWINFKREGNNHWHEDNTDQISYHAYVGATENQNEKNLVVGKGYLLALGSDEGTLMQSHGTLNGGTEDTEITFDVTRQGENCTGYNFLGNPYPSYIDFDEFASTNSVILGGTGYLEYMTLNEGRTAYVYYVNGSSANSHESVAPRYIHAHQGFIINAANGGTITFNEDMRTNAGTETYRKDNDTIAFPLVNLFATDSDGKQEIAVIELGRPEAGGAIKMRDMHFANCVMYARYEEENYAIAFTKEGETSVPVRFETINDDNFTLTWETRNGTFEYLHLIDNLTGADIDMLTCNNYKFNGKVSDYSSRFKLVFEYTGVEENEEEIAQDNFAFMMNDNLVVTGEGYLELIDLNGRTLYETRLTDAQTTVGLPDVAKGLYLLRLTNNKEVNTQKIVIK